MKYADLRQALKNCTEEGTFEHFMGDNHYKPFGDFYHLCKFISDDVFIYGTDKYDEKDLSVIRECMREVRERGWVEFEDREEFMK